MSTNGCSDNGGYRPNSGPKQKPSVEFDSRDAQEFLLDVMQGKIDPSPNQLKAAIAAAKNKAVAIGKKGEQKANAEDVVSAGKFAPSAPPKLVVNN